MSDQVDQELTRVMQAVSASARPAPDFPVADSPARSRRPNRRRMLLVSVGALVAAVVTAAAATWLVNPGRTNEIACAGEFIMRAVSGDPVADCAAELDRMGIEHGELAAYVNQFGGVAVREVDDVPSGWTPFGDNAAQDLALIRLDEDLNDHVDGLASDCFTAEEAAQLASEAIARYGLAGIPVTVRHPTSGPDRCASGSVLGDGAEVGILMDIGPTRGEFEGARQAPWAQFVTTASAALDNHCLPLDDAAEVVRQIASDTGIESTLVVSPVATPEMECTELSVVIGGNLRAILRGPAN